MFGWFVAVTEDLKGTTQAARPRSLTDFTGSSYISFACERRLNHFCAFQVLDRLVNCLLVEVIM